MPTKPSTRVSAEPPLLLTSAEVAKLLGLSRSEVYRADARGDLPRPVKFIRSRRWSRVELHAWAEAGFPPRHRWEEERT